MKIVDLATFTQYYFLMLFLSSSFLVTPARSFLHPLASSSSRLLYQPANRAFLIRGGSSSSSSSSSRAFTSTTKMAATSKPFAVVVQAEIKPDRMDEFLEMIKFNAESSRKEPGCIRFDVLRSQDNPNQFIFYELYKDMAAVDFHKAQPHYAKWADFKESGGTVTSVSYKNDGEFVEL